MSARHGAPQSAAAPHSIQIPTIIKGTPTQGQLRRSWRHTLSLAISEDNRKKTWRIWCNVVCASTPGLPNLVPDPQVYLLDYKKYLCSNRFLERKEAERVKKDARTGQQTFPWIFGKTEPRFWKDFLTVKSDVVNITNATIGESIKHHPALLYPQLEAVVLLIDSGIKEKKKTRAHVSGHASRPSGSAAAAAPAAATSSPPPQYVANVKKQYLRGLSFVGPAVGLGVDKTALAALATELESNVHYVLQDAVGSTSCSDLRLISSAFYLQHRHIWIDPFLSQAPAANAVALARKQSGVCSIWLSNGPTRAQPHPIGTGFMISSHHMMTCFHNLYTVPRGKQPLERRAVFPPTSQQFFVYFPASDEPSYLSFKLDQVIYPTDHVKRRSIGFDVAIVDLAPYKIVKSKRQCFQLFEKPSKAVRFVETGDLPDDSRQQVHLMGFPSTSTLTLPQGANRVVGFSDWEAMYNCATGKGMSGGPGTLGDGRLMFVHRRAGESTFTSQNQKKPFYSAGVRIDLFLRDALGIGPRPVDALRLNLSSRIRTMLKSLCKFYHVAVADVLSEAIHGPLADTSDGDEDSGDEEASDGEEEEEEEDEEEDESDEGEDQEAEADEDENEDMPEGMDT